MDTGGGRPSPNSFRRGLSGNSPPLHGQPKYLQGQQQQRNSSPSSPYQQGMPYHSSSPGHIHSPASNSPRRPGMSQQVRRHSPAAMDADDVRVPRVVHLLSPSPSPLPPTGSPSFSDASSLRGLLEPAGLCGLCHVGLLAIRRPLSPRPPFPHAGQRPAPAPAQVQPLPRAAAAAAATTAAAAGPGRTSSHGARHASHGHGRSTGEQASCIYMLNVWYAASLIPSSCCCRR